MNLPIYLMNPFPAKSRILPRSIALGFVAIALVGISLPSAFGQTWDGNGDANASGNWATGVNWSTNAVPTGVTNLNNVTSGDRTVTIDSAVSNITQLNLTQTTTTDASNFLSIIDNNLSVVATSGNNAVAVTLGAGVPVTNAGVNISGSGSLTLASIVASNSVATAQPNTFVNGGTLAISGNGSLLRDFGGTSTNAALNLNNSGVVTLGGTGANVLIGYAGLDERNHSTTINNTGTFQVVGGTANLGQVEVVGSAVNRRGTVTFNNEANASASIAGGATLTMWTRSGANNNARNGIVDNKEDASFTIGAEAQAATLSYRFHYGSGTQIAGTQRFTNAGTLNINGGSVIELSNLSSIVQNTFTFQNTATGTTTLHGTSRIGNTDRRTAFTNEGIFNKTGAGIATVQSAALGTAANSGTLHVQAGTLAFSTALTNSGNIRGNGTLQTAGITSTGGNFAAGNSIGTLTLALAAPSQVIDFDSPTTFTFELGTPDGVAGVNNDLIAFTGLNTTGTNVLFDNNTVNFTNAGGLGEGLYTLFTFDQANRYTGTLNIGSGLESFSGSSFFYNIDNIQLNLIPEPGTGALLLGAFGLLAIRSRRRLR